MIDRQSDQGSEKWFLDRLGCATASCFGDILAVSKRDGKPLKARDDYLMSLVCQRLTGEPASQINNFALTWGTDAEPYARKEYELQTGNIIREVGFKKHPSFQWVGASSDGLIGGILSNSFTAGAIEIKCPYNSSIHLNTIEHGMPSEHIPQVQGQMWVLGLEWVDFCSYDPRMPSNLKLFVERIYRNQEYIMQLEKDVLDFLDVVQYKVDSFLKIAA